MQHTATLARSFLLWAIQSSIIILMNSGEHARLGESEVWFLDERTRSQCKAILCILDANVLDVVQK